MLKEIIQGIGGGFLAIVIVVSIGSVIGFALSPEAEEAPAVEAPAGETPEAPATEEK